jgi:drug/metabolite transporter (DMT)-like permease
MAPSVAISPVALSLLAALQFGAALVATQIALRHATPASGARISILTSFVLLSIAALLWADREATDWRGAAVFAAVGLVFPVAVTRLTFEANRLLGPALAAALGNLAPVFAVLGAALFLAQVPGLAQAAGLAAIAVGVALLPLARGGGSAAWPIAAALLPLAAAAIRGLVQPATQWGLAFWPSPLAAAAIGYAVSAMVVVLTVRAPRPSGPALGWFAAVGLCNGGAVLTLYAALAAGPVILVAPLVATYPLVTLALAAFLPHRAKLTPATLAAIAATVAGVMLLLAG